MDKVSFALKGICIVVVSSTLLTLLALFAPNMLSQTALVSGTPISLPERIAYPVLGPPGLPPCNSRTSGKAYLFNDSLYSSADCNGTDWDHYLYGSTPVIPPVIANFPTITNPGATTSSYVGGTWQIAAPVAAGDNFRLFTFPEPTPPYTMTLGIAGDFTNANFHFTGIALRLSGTGQFYAFGWLAGGSAGPSAVQGATFTNPTTVATGSTGNAAIQGPTIPLYIRVVQPAGAGSRVWQTNRNGRLTGIGWHTVITEAWNTFIDQNQVGVFVNVNNATCPINALIVHCDINGVPCG